MQLTVCACVILSLDITKWELGLEEWAQENADMLATLVSDTVLCLWTKSFMST